MNDIYGKLEATSKIMALGFVWRFSTVFI